MKQRKLDRYVQRTFNIRLKPFFKEMKYEWKRDYELMKRDERRFMSETVPIKIRSRIYRHRFYQWLESNRDMISLYLL